MMNILEHIDVYIWTNIHRNIMYRSHSKVNDQIRIRVRGQLRSFDETPISGWVWDQIWDQIHFKIKRSLK